MCVTVRLSPGMRVSASTGGLHVAVVEEARLCPAARRTHPPHPRPDPGPGPPPGDS